MKVKKNKLKVYNKPKLKVHGDLKKITTKSQGSADGSYKTGPPISGV